MLTLTGNYPREIDVCAQSPIGSSFFVLVVDLSIAEVGKVPLRCRRVIRMAESVLFVGVGKGGRKGPKWMGRSLLLSCFRRKKVLPRPVQFPLQNGV